MKSTVKSNYLGFTLAAFASLLLEFLALAAEAFFYGNADFREWSLGQTLLHWTATCVLWGFAAYLLYLGAKKRGFDLLAIKEKPTIRNLGIVFLGLCFCIVVSFISWDFVFKPIAEWNSKRNTFGSGGAVAFMFQYLYYLVESVLILLVVCFGQKFGETVFRFKNTALIPWGGFICGLTWGLGHVFSQNLATGLQLWLITVFYGIAYILLRKNVKYTYVAIALMFIL